MTKNFLIEVSYEVCNKVGGIYTLLQSKTPYVMQEYARNYVLVGPYVHSKAVIDFEEQDLPDELIGVIDGLLAENIKCHYGRWLIEGTPNAILVDYSGYAGEADAIKKRLWEFAGVDSLFADAWFNDPLVWSTAAGILIDRMFKAKDKDCACIAHFHEWLTGGALLALKQKNAKIPTVFTTHATVLGRTLSDLDEPVYSIIKKGRDGDENLKLALQHNVLPKHTMELACAKHADIFTTVSEITAMEAEYFLERKPDFTLPGGIDLDKYPTTDEITIKRKANRRRVRDFLISYFNRYYPMDVYNITSVFISGRYEFHNKGIDLFIDALGRLNELMQKEGTQKNVVAFLWIPSNTKGENFQVLRNKSTYEEMKHHIEKLIPQVEDDIIASLSNGVIPKHMLDDKIKHELKRLAHHFTERRGETPPLCAYELDYPLEKDSIIQALWKNKLLNRQEDKVKVIYYPSYLSKTDQLIPLDYGDAAMTCDVGVFPSYYEPWGYTPLETAALGCLSITTDLAGFGRFIEGKGKGVYVLKRENKQWDDVVSDLADRLYRITTLTKKELIEEKLNARKLASLADWQTFIQNYFNAYKAAAKSKIT